MKITRPTSRREAGIAVIVMLALLSIMLACITVNIRSLNRLDRELKLLEQRQTRRWVVLTATNLPPVQPPTLLAPP